MTAHPLVSVIIPTHNRPDFLKKTIDSALSQTYSNLEIIVISNGKNLENEKAIKSYKDSRILYNYQDNTGGPSSPRNHGIRLAKGEYVAFCDDDDIWLSDKIEKQIQALERNQECGLCYTKMKRFDEKKEWSLPHEEGNADFYSLLYMNTVPISSVFMKKALLDQWGGFEESKRVGTSEDYEFLLRHSLHTKFYFIDEYLLKYWSGDNRTTLLDHKSQTRSVLRYMFGLFGSYRSIFNIAPFHEKLGILKAIPFHMMHALKRIIYINFLQK